MTNDIKYVKIDRHAKSRGGFRVIQAIRKIEKRINEMNMKMWREILYPYEMAVDELILKFNNIQREYRNGIGEGKENFEYSGKMSAQGHFTGRTDN